MFQKFWKLWWNATYSPDITSLHLGLLCLRDILHTEGEEMMFFQPRGGKQFTQHHLFEFKGAAAPHRIRAVCTESLKDNRVIFVILWWKRPFEITSLSLKRCSITPTCFPTSFWAALYKRECDLDKMWWFFTHWQALWKHSIIKSVPSRYYKLILFKSMQKRLHELGTARMTNDLGWLKKIRALSFK